MLMSGIDKVPIGMSLLVVATLLAGSVVASLLRPRPKEREEPAVDA
jgi:hypothetical protein